MSSRRVERPTETRRARRPSLALALILGISPLATVADSELARLGIMVTDIDEIRGDIVVAVFGSTATFDSRTDPVAAARLSVEGHSIAWSVDLEADAAYAVIVYQDLNGNAEIDMRRFGRPREPYGFSNNARGAFGPPDFEDVSFVLPTEGVSIEIAID